MPRISRTLIAEREAFTTKNFEAGMSLDRANAALVEKWGMKMNPYRLKELFDAAIPGAKANAEAIKAFVPTECVEAPIHVLEPAPDKVVNCPAPSPISSKPMTFIRTYEAPTMSKGGGALMTAGKLAKAIEEDNYPMKDED